MDNRSKNITTNGAWLYGLTVFLLALSGFAQMPIFKRYYIADIPGLGWLAQFYVTHYLHYLAAILLLALGAYKVAGFILARHEAVSLSKSGAARMALMAGIIGTGVFLVLRNLSGVHFSPSLIILMDISHLGLVMSYLAMTLFCLAAGKQWTTSSLSPKVKR